MKTIAILLLTLAAATTAAGAHEIDPRGKIIVNCFDSGPVRVRMIQIADALEWSRYRAPQSVRQEMLGLAQRACVTGLTRVTFVPAKPNVDVQAPAFVMETH